MNNPHPHTRHHTRTVTSAADLTTGIRIALAAKHATGYPLDADPDTLQTRLAQRHLSAEAIWLAYTNTTPTGHALATRIHPTHPLWSTITDPDITTALQHGTLVELGGLSVHPDHHGQGIATALTRARLDWAATHHLTPVSCNWNNSPGSAALARRYGRVIGTHPDHPITLHSLALQPIELVE